MHQVGVLPQPQIDGRRALIGGHHVGRGKCAPGSMACEAGRCPIAETPAQARPQPVGRDQRHAAFLRSARGARRDCDPVAVLREVVDPSAERQRDSRMRAHRFQQHGLQVAAMDDPIGRVVALGGGRTERRPRQHPRRLRVPDPKLLRSDHVGLQPRAEAEGEQNARGIGRKLQARAGLFQTLHLVEHGYGESSLRERQRRRQAADARAGDDDPARGRHDRRLLRRNEIGACLLGMESVQAPNSVCSLGVGRGVIVV